MEKLQKLKMQDEGSNIYYEPIELSCDQINYFTELFFRFNKNSINFINTSGALEMAEVLGDPEGVLVLKQAFEIQGEELLPVFNEGLVAAYQRGSEEQKSYMIFILEKLIENTILQFSPHSSFDDEQIYEIEEDFGELGVNASRVITVFFQNTTKMEDLQILLKILNENITLVFNNEQLIHNLLEDFELKTYNYRNMCPDIARELYISYYEIIQKFLWNLRNDDELDKFRGSFYYSCRKRIVAAITFFYHLKIINGEYFKDNMTYMFENLGSKKIYLGDHYIFHALLDYPIQKINYLRIFHNLVRKFDREVRKNFIY